MAKTGIAFLIMLNAHEQDHTDGDTTLFTTIQTAWIVVCYVQAGKVKDGRIWCRFLDKTLVGQKMAILPKELLCPPFTQVSLDLVDPVTIKIVGAAKSTRGKTGMMKV